MTTPHAHLDWTPEQVARFWDYESQFPGNYFTYKHGAEILASVRAHLDGRRKVLDFGCGTGYLLDHLLSLGVDVGGADVSEQSLAEVAKKFGSRPRFLGASAPDDLVQRGERFDAVLLVEVVEHLGDDALESVFASVGKLVEPGGVVIITTPNDEVLEDQHIFCPSCERVFHRWQHMRSWSEASLRSYLEQRGYEIAESFTADFRHFEPAPLFKRLRRSWKRWRRRRGKQPHLVVVAKAPGA